MGSSATTKLWTLKVIWFCRLDLFQGTPRALFHLDDPIESNEHMSLVAGCTIHCTVQTHIGLLKVMHLLPENAIVGPNDIVPGVVDTIQSDSPHSKLFIFAFFSPSRFWWNCCYRYLLVHQLWLSMEHHNLVSINAPRRSEDWCFGPRTDVRSSSSQSVPAMTEVRTHLYHWATSLSLYIWEIHTSVASKINWNFEGWCPGQRCMHLCSYSEVYQ